MYLPYFNKFLYQIPYLHINEEQWSYIKETFNKDDVKESLAKVAMTYPPPYQEISQNDCRKDFNNLKKTWVYDLLKEGEWFAKGRDEIPNALLSEHTKKYAVHLRGPLAQVPALKNQQLQILPVGNEFSDQKGAIVSYRITFNSKAVQGAKVINDLVNDPDQEPIVSNDDGLVTLPLRNQGLNVVAAIYDEKSTNLNVFDKTEHLATLSFVLPHAAE